MKLILIICFVGFSNCVTAQRKIFGEYRDSFGSRIILRSDSTFKYTWHGHMLSSWTTGKWKFVADTIFFEMIPIYDTLSRMNSSGTFIDTLVLSADESSERILVKSTIASVNINYADTNIVSVASLLFPSGQNELFASSQNFKKMPSSLIFKRENLYLIVNGSLYKKKTIGSWTRGKKLPSWFTKIKI